MIAQTAVTKPNFYKKISITSFFTKIAVKFFQFGIYMVLYDCCFTQNFVQKTSKRTSKICTFKSCWLISEAARTGRQAKFFRENFSGFEKTHNNNCNYSKQHHSSQSKIIKRPKCSTLKLSEVLHFRSHQLLFFQILISLLGSFLLRQQIILNQVV